MDGPVLLLTNVITPRIFDIISLPYCQNDTHARTENAGEPLKIPRTAPATVQRNPERGGGGKGLDIHHYAVQYERRRRPSVPPLQRPSDTLDSGFIFGANAIVDKPQLPQNSHRE